MKSDPYYKAHWRNIDPDRMAAYRDGFGWDDATETLYAPAKISPGLTVLEFGCGPGKVAAEIAKRVGSDGQVNAIDINAEFLDLARDAAVAAGVSDRVRTHRNDGTALPLANGSQHRVTARNALMYVDDPVATLREFRRVLHPNGLAHAIDGDWFMMVAEPVEHDLWRAFVKAASFACRNSDMGRKLYSSYVQAGFEKTEVSIVARADVDGRLLGMIGNMAKYARASGSLEDEHIDQVLAQIDRALGNGTYLVVSPQFVVTGSVPG